MKVSSQFKRASTWWRIGKVFLFVILSFCSWNYFELGSLAFVENEPANPTRTLKEINVYPNTNLTPKPLPPKITKTLTARVKSKDNNLSKAKVSKESNNEEEITISKQKNKEETAPKPKDLNKITRDSLNSEPKDEFYLAVTNMPSFPGCHESNYEAQKSCSDNKLLRFINKNIQYPERASLEGIQGLVFISFIIEKNGTISNSKVINDIGGGCGEEALRVVNSMPRWIPGSQGGEPVRVQFNLPVRFQLQ